MGSGKVEKILMFSILVVIGLILIVAFRGAQDGELGGSDDGNLPSFKKSETANAKEGDANEGNAKERDVRSLPESPSTDRNRSERGPRESGTPRRDSGDRMEPGSKGPLPGPKSSSPKGEASLNDILQGLGTKAAQNPESADPATKVGPGSERSGSEQSGASAPMGRSERTVEDGSSDPKDLDRITLVPFEGSDRKGATDSGKGAASENVAERDGGVDAEEPSRFARDTESKNPPSPRDESAGLPQKAAKRNVKASAFVYSVRSGDSLYSIARNLFGDEHAAVDILAVNPQVANADHIVLGQELRLPDLPFFRREGVVEKADGKVADKTGKALSTNKSPSVTKSSGGKSPVGKSSVTDPKNQDSSTAGPTATTHTVQKGETLSSIAAKYYGASDRGGWKRIYDANKDHLKSADVVREGTELRIPR